MYYCVVSRKHFIFIVLVAKAAADKFHSFFLQINIADRIKYFTLQLNLQSKTLFYLSLVNGIKFNHCHNILKLVDIFGNCSFTDVKRGVFISNKYGIMVQLSLQKYEIHYHNLLYILIITIPEKERGKT